MQAKHPKTGKDIRILNTDASRWKDQKTLAFSSTVTPWDSVWTGPLEDGSPPTFRILLGKQAVSSMKEAMKSRFIFTEHVDANTNRYGFLPLEDLHLSFPQLGNEWDKTKEDAAAMIANLFHYQRFYSTLPKQSERLTIPLYTSPPEPLWFITQTYKPDSKPRAKEIESCLKRNAENHLISGILLLNESPQGFAHPKVKEEIIGHRITYKDVMTAIQSNPNIPENALVVFANADISLDPVSWRSLWAVNLKDVCIALLRYDVPPSGSIEDAALFGPRADSQDTWVVRASDVRARSLTGPSFDIPFGQMGCDNVFALEMLRQKFCVINPCHTLITWHFHSSGVRTYDKDDVIDRPMFHYIHPSGLHDMKPCLDLKPFIIHTFQSKLDRPVKGRGAANWIHTMGKIHGTESKWALDSMNTIQCEKQGVLALQNVYQTSHGLAYDSGAMYVGNGLHAQTTWANYPIKALSPTLQSEQGFIVPWPEGGEKREVYVLKYLAKVLRLRELSGWKGGDFFCPESIQSILKLFRWGVSPLPLIKYESDIKIWHQAAYVFPVDDGMIRCEDVEALRQGLGPFWKETIETESSFRTIVIVDSVLGELEEVLEKTARVVVVYPGKTSPERLLASLSGAWGIICPPGIEAAGWNWMLPKGAYVFEVDSNDDVALHISAAANLKHRFVTSKTILDEVLDSDAVKVFVPKDHPSNELIDMWAIKGYVQKNEGNECVWETKPFESLMKWPIHCKVVEEFVENGFNGFWEGRRGFADTKLKLQDFLVSLSKSLYVVLEDETHIVAALAMGCVPILQNTSLPEDTYLTEERDLSREDWERISEKGHRWWKDHWSCDGSFNHIKKLISEL
jgi:hypothetical protein